MVGRDLGKSGYSGVEWRDGDWKGGVCTSGCWRLFRATVLDVFAGRCSSVNHFSLSHTARRERVISWDIDLFISIDQQYRTDTCDHMHQLWILISPASQCSHGGIV